MKMIKSFGKFPLLVIFSMLLGWQLPAVAAETLAAADQTVVMTVNINTAEAAVLAEGLNGVGEKRAQAIVDYRQQHGVFTSVEQLLEVKGIGEAVLSKNQAKIVLK